jgi:hypothetical protein
LLLLQLLLQLLYRRSELELTLLNPMLKMLLLRLSYRRLLLQLFLRPFLLPAPLLHASSAARECVKPEQLLFPRLCHLTRHTRQLPLPPSMKQQRRRKRVLMVAAGKHARELR